MVNIDELIETELTNVFELVEALGFPRDAFEGLALSCGLGYGAEEYASEEYEEASGMKSGATIAEELDYPQDEIDKHRADFNRLCGLAPFIPRNAIAFVGSAYTTLLAVRNGERGYDSTQNKLEGVVHAARGWGRAAGILESANLLLIESSRKKMLSDAGQKGATAKNAGTRHLRNWAIDTASKMRGADIDLSRQLAARLPLQLADVSKSPQRLIYDALRARKKSG